MNILGIEITNYKGLKAFFLNPNGANVHVSGKTGQGKTTAISALWDIIKTVGKPIKDGEKNSTIKLILGAGVPEVTAIRHFTPKTKTISITTTEGEPVTVEEFKTWFSTLGINPHKLIEKKPMELTNILLETVSFPDGFDYLAVNQAMEDLEIERKDLAREVKRMEKELGEEPEFAEQRDLSDLLLKWNKTVEAIGVYDKAQEDFKRAEEKMIRIREEIEGYQKTLDELRKRESDGNAYLCTMKKWLKDNHQTRSTLDELDIQIKDLSENNKKAEAHSRWVEKVDALESKNDISRRKSRALKQLHNQKKDALDAAEWPLEGIGIQNGEIFYNGIPLAQLGTSKQLLICGTLAAKQIADKPLKVVRLDGVESMDPEDFAELEKTFNKYDIQVLSSRVDRSGSAEPGEILIEEGEIKCG